MTPSWLTTRAIGLLRGARLSSRAPGRAAVPSEPLSLEIRRFFPASRERLYRCFTEAEHLTRWFGPQGVSCPRASVDARPDGRYRIEMANPDGSPAVVVGRFLELDPPKLVRMTWCWERWANGPTGEETLVTVRFEDAPGGTLLTLTHERFSNADTRQTHRGGWESTLDCLIDYVHQRAPVEGEGRA